MNIFHRLNLKKCRNITGNSGGNDKVGQEQKIRNEEVFIHPLTFRHRVNFGNTDFWSQFHYFLVFATIEKSSMARENEWTHTKLLHQEVFVKLEYPLWKF